MHLALAGTFMIFVTFCDTLASKKQKQARQNSYLTCYFHGAPGRIRTVDTRFRRAVLYPLSYGGARVFYHQSPCSLNKNTASTIY